jgi:hypothetical protein
MEKITVRVIETRTYEIEIEATDESHAIEQVRDFDGDDLEPYETSVAWDFEA